MGAAEELMATAERLFAAEGIDAVSLRQITREAGQRNVMALQYHFGDREGLLVAVIDKHTRPMSVRTHELLDAAGDQPSDDRTVAGAGRRRVPPDRRTGAEPGHPRTG
jgi:AcrR family transcriptional regulator